MKKLYLFEFQGGKLVYGKTGIFLIHFHVRRKIQISAMMEKVASMIIDEEKDFLESNILEAL